MKTVRRLAASMLATAATMATSLADSTSTSGPPPQEPTHFEQYQMAQQRDRSPTPAEVAADKQAREKQEQDRDWLLNGYEQQQARNRGSAASSSPDLYYHYITTDKDLSKLAGTSTGSSKTPDPGVRTGLERSNSSVTLRSDTGSKGTSPFATRSIFKPFFTPLAASSSPPGASSGAPPLSTSGLFPASKPEAKTASVSGFALHDPLALETPGQIAEDNNPTGVSKISDLTFDLPQDRLPDETGTHSNKQQQLDLPPPANIAQLHQQETMKLTAPGHTKTPDPKLTNPPIVPIAPSASSEMVRIPSTTSQLADPSDFFTQ